MGAALKRVLGHDSVAPKLEPVVQAGAPVRVRFIDHPPCPPRDVRVLTAHHQAPLEQLQGSVPHVLEARKLGLS